MIGTDAFQEIDTYGLTVPITKHNFLVRSAAELARRVPRRRFASPPPDGPDQSWSTSRRTCRTSRSSSARCPSPEAPILRRALDDEIVSARRSPDERRDGPCCSSAPASSRAGASCEVCARWQRKRPFPSPPRFSGSARCPMTTLSSSAWSACTPRAARICCSRIATYWSGSACGSTIAPPARPRSFAHARRSSTSTSTRASSARSNSRALGIVADVGDALRALEPRVAAAARDEWIAHLAQLRAAYPLAMPGADDPLHALQHHPPHRGARPRRQHSHDRRRPTSDVGRPGVPSDAAAAMADLGRARHDGVRSARGHRRGARAPGRTVVCFSGDGSLLMNRPGARHGGGRRREREGDPAQQRASRAWSASNSSSFTAGAITRRASSPSPTSPRSREGSASRAWDLDDATDPLATLAQALAAPGPCLINVPIDAENNVYPMVPPGGANRDMIGGETRADDRQ